MKGRPEQSEGRKHAGGMFSRPWESPCASERTRMGVGGCALINAEVYVDAISKVCKGHRKVRQHLLSDFSACAWNLDQAKEQINSSVPVNGMGIEQERLQSISPYDIII